ncbi:hypothetical protein CAP48_12790 [Advenella sp. S44]|uniref:hypothetical protein n=1 Tax=Advenella sp. S44 TaxID=1982755 RepID=UPI000C29A432|nr:hypothetical protein [Advenella sp. S44]PJX23344.1 hypothetical protein CAP48_12790 [Advenella sp. S44]
MNCDNFVRLSLIGLLSLPVVSNAEVKSIENNKSISQGVKENPIMGYVVPKTGDLRIHKVHSEPKKGSLSVIYNNEQKVRLTNVNAQRIPPGLDKIKAAKALGEGIEKALVKDNSTTPEKQEFTTPKGVHVNCVGVLMKDKPASNRLCYAVFNNYYVQTNMVWKMEKKNDENAFSRSDDFVTTVMDRFSDYPEL